MQSNVIKYHVTLENLAEHTLKIDMQIELTDAVNKLVLSLPAWIPGSYMIRDFAKNLHQLTFSDPSSDASQNIELNQIDKQTWQISSDTLRRQFTLSYRIFAFDLSVRSAFIDDQYSFFNGTSTFLYTPDIREIQHIVTIDKDSFSQHGNNTRIATSMPQLNDSQEQFNCDSYHQLIEHPFLIGQFQQSVFKYKNVNFYLVFTGNNHIDLDTLERDLKPIIDHHITLFGEFPCDDYRFITLISDNGYGGLEHGSCTILHYNRGDLTSPFYVNQLPSEGYQQFLALCSHELFHTWHVKRIKPEKLHNTDLSKEVYTPQLWIFEGFTSFYDDFSLAKSKLISPEQYLKVLENNFNRLLKNSGRHKQAVDTSSFEAWSKFYQQTPSSINHITSYYNKGGIIAMCLDIHLMKISNGEVCLDDVMSTLWQQHGKTLIGTKDDVIESICNQKFNLDIHEFIETAVHSIKDLDYASLLENIGLELQLVANSSVKQGCKDGGALQYDIGATYIEKNNFLTIKQVYSDRAASQSGLIIGDIIIAVNKLRCTEKQFINSLYQCQLGDTMLLDVLRDGRLIELNFVVAPAIPDSCNIKVVNKTRYHDWLYRSHTKG